MDQWSDSKKENYCNDVGYKNVDRSIQEIRQGSSTLDKLISEEKIALVGAINDIKTAEVLFFQIFGCNPSTLKTAAETGFLSRIIECQSLINF